MTRRGFFAAVVAAVVCGSAAPPPKPIPHAPLPFSLEDLNRAYREASRGSHEPDWIVFRSPEHYQYWLEYCRRERGNRYVEEVLRAHS